jgi:hypothetical protein
MSAEYLREWKKANKAKVARYGREHYQRYRELLISMAVERRQQNPKSREASREAGRRYYWKHREKILAAISSDPERVAKRSAAARAFEKRNPAKTAIRTKRRQAVMKRASPPWLTAEQWAEMDAVYAAAKERGSGWQVDHIHPLQGRNSCGLHVPWNLQVLDGLENRRKANRLPQ